MASTPEPTIDRRLDLLEQALFGLLPRQERLEIVAQVESRAKALLAAGTVNAADLPLPSGIELARSASAIPRNTRSQLSTLALFAGLIGIAAILLMFALPVTYLLAAALSDALGETGLIAALGTHVVLLAVCGGGAILLAILAFIRFSRHPETLRGRGWAITGLCTGPMPLFLGGILSLMISAEFVASAASFTVPTATATTNGAYGVSPVATASGCPNLPAGCVPVQWSAGPTLMPPPLPALPPANGPVMPLPSAPSMLPPATTPVVDAPKLPPAETPAPILPTVKPAAEKTEEKPPVVQPAAVETKAEVSPTSAS